MAKRKRLTPPTMDNMAVSEPIKSKTARSASVPIADMAGAASATAALETLALEVHDARTQGRMIISVPLDQIDEHHLVRDRAGFDAEDMQALTASLVARGQQTAIEVVVLAPKHYGLISGWRRLTALRQLYAQTGDAQYGEIRCVIRSPDTASDAYLAMVEENEIRSGLSFYERARIAARAAEQGAFETAREAVKGLFAAVSAPKRSKIHAFGVLYTHLDGALSFANDIPEHLGLALAKALETQDGFAADLQARLTQADVSDPREERRVLEQALSGLTGQGAASRPRSSAQGTAIAPGIILKAKRGQIVLSGENVNEALRAEIEAWLVKNRA